MSHAPNHTQNEVKSTEEGGLYHPAWIRMYRTLGHRIVAGAKKGTKKGKVLIEGDWKNNLVRLGEYIKENKDFIKRELEKATKAEAEQNATNHH